MTAHRFYAGLVGVLALSCGGAPPGKKSVALEQAPVLSAGGLVLRFDEPTARFAELSMPGLDLDLAAMAEHVGVSLYDHTQRVLLDSSTTPVTEHQLSAATLSIVRESPDERLRVVESWIARDGYIEVEAVITDAAMTAGDGDATGDVGPRPIEACLALPGDFVGKRWHHHIDRSEVIAEGQVYRTLLTMALDIGHWARPGLSTHFKSDLPFNLHGVNMIGDDTTGLAVAMHPDAPAAYYVEYDAGARHLRACFHLGLHPRHRTQPGRTSLRLVMFHVDESRWGLRAALAGYARMLPEGFRSRVPRRTLMTADGSLDYDIYPDPARFHIGAGFNAFSARNRQAGVKNLMYSWPAGFLDRSIRLGATPVTGDCSECDASVNAKVAACLALYKDYEAGVVRFPETCADPWAQSRCRPTPLDPNSKTYGPVEIDRRFYSLHPRQVVEPTNLVLRLLGKFALHDPLQRSIMRDAGDGYVNALTTGRAIVLANGSKDTYTCFINGINPDPGIEVLERSGKPLPEGELPPIETANFGELNLEIAKRATGVYGLDYVHTDDRRTRHVYDGVAVDTVGAYLRPDFHEPMLEVSSYSLGYDRATGKLVNMEHLGLTAFLRALRRSLPHEAVLAINGYPISGTLGQDADLFVRELGRRWRQNPGDDKPKYYHELYDEDLDTRLRRVHRQRLVAYNRSITFWARFTYTEQRAAERGKTPEEMLLEDMRRYLPLYTAKGIYVFIQRTGIGGRDLFFQKAQDPEIMREYERHLDIVHALTEAGWEPIPHVLVNDSTIIAERFGKSLITLHNPGEHERPVRASLDWSKMGFSTSSLRVRDFETGDEIPVTAAGALLELPEMQLQPNQVRVLTLEPG